MIPRFTRKTDERPDLFGACGVFLNRHFRRTRKREKSRGSGRESTLAGAPYSRMPEKVMKRSTNICGLVSCRCSLFFVKSYSKSDRIYSIVKRDTGEVNVRRTNDGRIGLPEGSVRPFVDPWFKRRHWERREGARCFVSSRIEKIPVTFGKNVQLLTRCVLVNANRRIFFDLGNGNWICFPFNGPLDFGGCKRIAVDSSTESGGTYILASFVANSIGPNTAPGPYVKIAR